MLTELIQNMLSNRRIFVDLVGKRSRCRREENGPPQGSVLVPCCLTSIQMTSQFPERQLSVHCHSEAVIRGGGDDSWGRTGRPDSILHCHPPPSLGESRENSDKNLPSEKPRLREPKVVWHGKLLAYSHKPVYIGVTLDRCLTCKDHIAKTEEKPGTRSSILKKLTNTNWGTDAITIP